MKLIFATGNENKMREIREILAGRGYEILSMKEAGIDIDVEENGKTFSENALIKARAISKASGELVLADDSGLEIAVLGGAPGIYSARFAGYHADDAANNQKMVEELQKAGVAESAADYRCALVFMGTDGKVLTAEGRCDGQVKLLAKGENGFGYDPYFYPLEYPGRTMAELTLEEKQVISHRGKALKELAKALEDHWK